MPCVVASLDEIGVALDALMAVLTDLRRDLPTGDGLDTVFESANRWRERLKKTAD